MYVAVFYHNGTLKGAPTATPLDKMYKYTSTAESIAALPLLAMALLSPVTGCALTLVSLVSDWASMSCCRQQDQSEERNRSIATGWAVQRLIQWRLQCGIRLQHRAEISMLSKHMSCNTNSSHSHHIAAHDANALSTADCKDCAASLHS